MRIMAVNMAVNFKGLLQIADNCFVNTDHIVYVEEQENNVCVGVNHSERPHAKPNDGYTRFYSSGVASPLFWDFDLPKNITLERAVKAYSKAARSKDAVVSFKEY